MIHPGKATEELSQHYGHEVEIAVYGPLDEDVHYNSSIECITCGTVLIDSECMELMWQQLEEADGQA